MCILVEKIPGLPLTDLAKEFEGGNAFIEDLGEVVDAILRIHFIYDLNVTEVFPKQLEAIHLWMLDKPCVFFQKCGSLRLEEFIE